MATFLKSIFSIFLIFLLCQTIFASFSAFNCQFVNNQFDVGIYEDGEPAIFARTLVDGVPVQDPNSLKTTIENAVRTVIRANWYNSVDDFLLFYHHMKNYDTNLMMGFRHFGPSVDLNSNAYGETWRIFDSIRRTYSQLKTAMYFVSVYPLVSTDYISRALSENSLPTDFIHGQTAGVLRFKDGGTKGIFLIDTEIFKETVLMMYDYQEDEISVGNYNCKFKENTYGTQKYIHCSHQYDENIHYLYSIELPFCGFVKTTTKYRLFESKRKLIKRNRYGMPTESISFDIFENGIFNWYINGASTEMSFADLDQYNQNYFKETSFTVKYSPTYLYDKLKEIGEMFNNTDFIDNYRNLTEIRHELSYV